MTTVEDIERQQRRRRIAFRLIMLLLLVLLCVFLGWIISRIGYKELHSTAQIVCPAPAPVFHAHVLHSGA